ncbi:MAG: hypothetical protein KC619_13130 [Myxococcales bacterium]|nr:hypothetical protein [Myxococcales bacterium]
MRRFAWLLLLLPACGTPCPTDPLAPLAEPGWVLRMNEAPDVTPPTGTPGLETYVDPPGLDTYAAFAVYDGAGNLANERWLDTYTVLEGVAATVNAATALPSRLAPGALTVLLADGTRPALTFDPTTGNRSLELASYASAPSVAGQLVDLSPLDDGRAVVTRRRGEGGVGGDVLVVDTIADRGVLETFSLAGLSSGPVEPGAIARLGATAVDPRVVIGLALIDEPSAGAVAVVNPDTGDVVRYDVPGLSWCGEAVALAPSDVGAGRVGVLCSGDLTRPPEERSGVGLALLEAAPDGPVALVAGRTASTLFSNRLPTYGLVALAGTWVAAVSGGDPEVGRPDALLAVDLGSDAATVLVEEVWTDLYGAPLGQGDFRGTELWWPSARGAVYRFSMTGTDAAATFAALDPAPLPSCSRLPAREVRAIPALPTP